MRAILVFLVLLMLYLLVRYGGGAEIAASEVNPTLVGFAALFIAGIVTAELIRPLLGLMGPLSRFVVVAILAAMTWIGFDAANRSGLIPKSMLGTLPDPSVQKVYQTEVPKSWDGLYRAIAQVNARSVGALIDLSVPLVVLQYEEAERMGLHPERAKFETRISVGDTKIDVAPLQLVSVQIDKVVVLNVKGAVAAKGALTTSLIGLSYLENLRLMTLRDGALVLQN